MTFSFILQHCESFRQNLRSFYKIFLSSGSNQIAMVQTYDSDEYQLDSSGLS